VTLLFFYWGYKNERKRGTAYLLMYVPMGLGTLNMGPVNLIMPAIVTVVIQFPGRLICRPHCFKNA
jgi:hypothetical protein